MKLNIRADFYEDQTSEDAVALLAQQLTASLKWRTADHGVIELRGLNAQVTVQRNEA